MATATSDNNNEHKRSTVGLLLIIADVISTQQRDEVIVALRKALQQIDYETLSQVEDTFNNLLTNDEFQAGSQYRRIANSNNGSTAGFLYLPNFHTVVNILKDFFQSCSRVTLIFCGQQIDGNGALMLADSIFTVDHLHSLLEDNSIYVIQDLQIVLPNVAPHWTRLSKQKKLKNIQVDDLSKEPDEQKIFGERFYERLVQVLTKETANFDIYSKLVPRDSSGTIAFDEPNLYILYGQQGEASLFGIRGFVVLINGGYSRMPSYWNLIRGLQNIDACILTHFDYDVLPGLQTILHRKTMSSLHDGRACKPDIGAIFLNHIQRARIQSAHSNKTAPHGKLSVSLSQNIEQLLTDIKQLNIDTYDLVRHTLPNKPTIEPINLYKKIAFGSLDLYVLYPSTSADDDKALSSLQKIPIRDQQPSPAMIPLHHWYSSCSLLVWTPTSKSSKESIVRVLYTGACPQTLVFEALARGRHLEFLHECPQQSPTIRAGSVRPPSSGHATAAVKPPAQKPKPTVALANGEPAKNPPRPSVAKPKTSTALPIKPRSAPTTTAKKASVPSTKTSTKEKANEAESDERESNSDRSEQVRSTQDLSDPAESDQPLQRPESVSFADETNEPFVESSTATPIDESATQLISHDPMTTSFVDGAPNTRNPFLDQGDDMEIIHHSVSHSNKSLMPSIDEIIPQNLPIDEENSSKKPNTKKPTPPANPARKSKQAQPSGAVFYVDVAYIPYHGNEHYVDSEFFRRIRARYYVLNAVEISRLTLESLIDGKQQWEKQEQTPVTLVPTFDGDQLRQFFVANKSRLAELNINILPASTRCNVQYDDEGSPAQRLRFSQEQ